MEITILYYSACTEHESFEQRIRDNITNNCNGIPIVSVTQKPIDFGKNICVGEHKNMYINQFLQMLIGLREIDTKYTLIAEADFLYPPEYFQFVPDGAVAYRYHDVYVMFCLDMLKKARYYLKVFSDGAQMVDTQFFRDLLEKAMEQASWDMQAEGKGHGGYLFHRSLYKTWRGNPAVTFKTGEGVAKYTAVKRYDGRYVAEIELPYWGKAAELRDKMFKKEGL